MVKTLHRLDRLAEEDDAWGDLDDICELPSDKRRAISENVALLERRLRGVKLRLSALDEAQTASSRRDVGDHVRWRRSTERRPSYDERLPAQAERSAGE